MTSAAKKLRSAWNVIQSAADRRGQIEKGQLLECFRLCGVVTEHNELRIPNNYMDRLKLFELRTNEIDLRNTPAIASFASAVIRILKPKEAASTPSGEQDLSAPTASPAR